MEKRDYRDNLERICARFSGELIPLLQVAEYLGCDKRSLMIDKTFPTKKLGGVYGIRSLAAV
jgi:hypothetical protein